MRTGRPDQLPRPQLLDYRMGIIETGADEQIEKAAAGRHCPIKIRSHLRKRSVVINPDGTRLLTCV
jgi:hypothetical protein